jgi:hypothetical protein
MDVVAESIARLADARSSAGLGSSTAESAITAKLEQLHRGQTDFQKQQTALMSAMLATLQRIAEK